MPRYLLVEDTAQSHDRFTLELADDGTFTWSYAASDPAGAMGGGFARGTWRRAGATYTFTVTEGDEEIAPQAATQRDARHLEVAGIGTMVSS